MRTPSASTKYMPVLVCKIPLVPTFGPGAFCLDIYNVVPSVGWALSWPQSVERLWSSLNKFGKCFQSAIPLVCYHRCAKPLRIIEYSAWVFSNSIRSVKRTRLLSKACIFQRSKRINFDLRMRKVELKWKIIQNIARVGEMLVLPHLENTTPNIHQL